MKVKFEHSESVSVDEVCTLVHSASPVATSPHVGNLDQFTNPGYLALSAIGVPLMFVDTTSADDRHGQPSFVINGGEQTPITNLGRNKRKKLVPAAAPSTEQGLSLQELHLAPIKAAGLDFLVTSAYETGIHPDLPEALLESLAIVSPDRCIRISKEGRVSSSPGSGVKASDLETSEAYKNLGIFGHQDSGSNLDGIIIPAEAGIAADLVNAVLSGSYSMTHIGGSDMTKYSKGPDFMRLISGLAEHTLSIMGVQPSQPIAYSILNKNGGIKGLDELSSRIASSLGIENFSQHDLNGTHPSKLI